jgi:hypothetical protein
MPLDQALLDQLTPDLTVEVDGKPIPLRETNFVKEAPDFKTFVRGAYDAHREVGARIPVKHDGKPESIEAWRKTHIPTLQKEGLLRTPPASPKDYGVVKPENLPEGLSWDDARAEKYAGILHKYGVPKEIVPELMELHQEALTGAHLALKTSKDAGIAALKKEYGAEYDSRIEEVKRFTPSIIKTPEELEFLEATGLGNHPAFLSVMMRLAHNALADSSVLAGLPGVQGPGGLTGDEVRKELADIMSNTQNEKHKLYWQKDKATMDYVEGLYKKAYGEGKVEIG